MPEQRGFIDNSVDPISCEALWGENKCPNAPEFLIIVKSKPGFAVMCGPHRVGFDNWQGGHDYTVEPYTFRRAKELQTIMDAAYPAAAQG